MMGDAIAVAIAANVKRNAANAVAMQAGAVSVNLLAFGWYNCFIEQPKKEQKKT
jgi:hypothetical protein